MEAARHCRRLGLPIQVNTLVAKETADDLPAIYELLRTSFPVMRWSLFFLISVGRGTALNEVPPAQESIMRWVFDLSRQSPFAIKTTEALSYRCIALDIMRSTGMATPEMKATSVYKGFQIRDGHGIGFVSNLGHIYPSGFLPLGCGNVRTGSLVDVYRNSEIFRALHSPDQFHGKCGGTANTVTSAEDRAPGPLPTPAMLWAQTRSVPTEPVTPTTGVDLARKEFTNTA